jgi:tetratricopeptide (TPR) repeat protein
VASASEPSSGPAPIEPLRPDTFRAEQLPVRERAALDRLGLEFLAEFFEIARRHRPEDVETLAELGHVYTRLGRFEEGLEVDQLLVRLVPGNATVHYNLACSLALCGRPDEAIDQLETAVRVGYADAEHLAADEDLISLRTQPRFQALLARLANGSSG